jgi:hypothetical protein
MQIYVVCVLNINRRKSIINLLRSIYARFMQIHVLNVNRRKSIINLLRSIYVIFM